MRLARRPIWLAGLGASAAGTALQLVALSRGSLVTVQPLLVCGLLFALPINAVLFRRRRPRVSELCSAGVVCVGLALFLVATDPERGTGQASATSWIVLLALLAAAVVVLTGLSLLSRGAVRAALLASAAGAINGVSAAFSKGVARGLRSSWHLGPVSAALHTLANWELYAFAATLLTAMLLVQSAFQSGPISWSLPALTAVNPITSVVIGVTILGEHIRSSAPAVLGAVTGLVLVTVGVLSLGAAALAPGAETDEAEHAGSPVPAPAAVAAALEHAVSLTARTPAPDAVGIPAPATGTTNG